MYVFVYNCKKHKAKQPKTWLNKVHKQKLSCGFCFSLLCIYFNSSLALFFVLLLLLLYFAFEENLLTIAIEFLFLFSFVLCFI